MLLARRYFLDNPPADASESLVFACLLHILHGNRPYALSRRSHPITPFAPTGPTGYRALIPRLRDKVERSLATPVPDEFCYGHSLFQDATEWWPAEINELDAVITSPPFFDSTRFYLGNWMRLWFCGWETADFQQRPMAFVDPLLGDRFRNGEPARVPCGMPVSTTRTPLPKPIPKGASCNSFGGGGFGLSTRTFEADPIQSTPGVCRIPCPSLLFWCK